MSKRNDKLLILDILDCIAKIQQYTKGYTLREFSRDTKTIDAVVRNIEIIGEATKHLSRSIKSRIALPWKQIVGMRNIIVHEYFGVDVKIVWRIVSSQLDEIKVLFEKTLSATDE